MNGENDRKSEQFFFVQAIYYQYGDNDDDDNDGDYYCYDYSSNLNSFTFMSKFIN